MKNQIPVCLANNKINQLWEIHVKLFVVMD